MEQPRRSVYQAEPKHCAPDDFWGQVKRTVNGRPVPQPQIDMIVAQVITHLDVDEGDVLLDLCCGNGALTRYFFDRCRGGAAVDHSEPLVRIAESNFLRRPTERFILQDVLDFARSWQEPDGFTIGICYGAFPYLPHEAAQELLVQLRHRFTGLRRLFLGNLPDRLRMTNFFGAATDLPPADDHSSAIGIWRSPDEVRALGDRTGWAVDAICMPTEYYAAHYRFDAVLTPS